MFSPGSFKPERANHLYVPAGGRYESMRYRRVGASGIELPMISLGLWQNFGDERPIAGMRAILRRAFDLGVTHFDLANNYGPPYGAAESNFGRILAEDLRPFRDELIISTKAGYDQWAGPYGDFGSRKHLLASLDQSLTRMNLEYVDIYYSHRPDPETPMQETMSALDTAVRQGKALYAGISSYSPEETEQAIEILTGLGTPLLIHQPAYSILNRTVEGGLLDVLRERRVGAIVFSPLAQGVLAGRYREDSSSDAQTGAREAKSLGMLTEENIAKARKLAAVAERRGQSLAQMSLAWVLRDECVSSAVIGASSVQQLEHNVGAVESLEFSDGELREIDSICGVS